MLSALTRPLRWSTFLALALLSLASATGLMQAQVGPAWPDIGGAWVISPGGTCGTVTQTPTISQSGQSLTFTNECGQSAAGHIADPSTVVADGWGGLQGALGGLVSNCYTRIDWANGTSWTRMAPAGGCATTLAGAGGASVWTVNNAGTQNPSQYHLGESLQICFSTPSLGAAVLTDLTPDGNSTVIDQYGGDATSQCPVTGTVAPPTGQECIRLDFTPVQGGVSGTAQSLQVCWQDVP